MRKQKQHWTFSVLIFRKQGKSGVHRKVLKPPGRGGEIEKADGLPISEESIEINWNEKVIIYPDRSTVGVCYREDRTTLRIKCMDSGKNGRGRWIIANLHSPQSGKIKYKKYKNSNYREEEAFVVRCAIKVREKTETKSYQLNGIEPGQMTVNLKNL